MKQVFLFITIISLIWTQLFNRSETKNAFDPLVTLSLTLNRDSGYITKKVGLIFLVSQSLTDTADSYWNQVSSNDSIGKYYMAAPNKFIIYCHDYGKNYLGRSSLLFEIYNDGIIPKIIAKERFVGSYNCCSEGLQKHGKFYSLKLCGTGSGYCESHIYLFNHAIPQNKLTLIPISMSWFGFGGYQTLYSSFNLMDTVLDVDYSYKKGTLSKDSTKLNSMNLNPATFSDRFSLKFIYKNDNWIMKDSILFKQKETEWLGI
jgi:hypothetical protein